jgi:TPP-dependent 2-oxoacid decarboxylase
MKIKIITGFREEQYYVIEAHEAHKAYYLFNNPEARTTFENGTALIGKNIQGIEPAWNESMNWNPTHQLDDDDWNDIRKNGLDKRIKNLLAEAREVALLAEKNPELLKMKLDEIEMPEKVKQISEEVKKLTDNLKVE